MRFQSDAHVLFDHIESSTRSAAEDIQRTAEANQSRRTGRLVQGMDLEEVTSEPGHTVMAMVSDAPYAQQVERGAWVRSGRGPHMRGNRVMRTAAKSFGRRMSARLRRLG